MYEAFTAQRHIFTFLKAVLLLYLTNIEHTSSRAVERVCVSLDLACHIPWAATINPLITDTAALRQHCAGIQMM